MNYRNASKLKPWECESWADYIDHFPVTPQLPESVNMLMEPFSSIWKTDDIDNMLPMGWQKRSDKLLIVLVRGLFGNLMPGNFSAVMERLSRLGVRVLRPRISTAGKVEDNAEQLQQQVLRSLNSGDEVIFLCQSKGGLDALWALMAYEALRKRTIGVVLMQTPSGESPVMRSILTDKYESRITKWPARVEEGVHKAIVSLPWFAGGCRQIMSPYIDDIVAKLVGFEFTFPVIAVATWSLEPSSWLDSYHRKINLIRPGCAHDGQFFLEDQLWPDFNQLVLGHIDHAESVMRGGGIDTARLWLSLAHLLDRELG